MTSELGFGIIFAAGYDARVLGVPSSANPIEPGMAAWAAWVAGWVEADKALASTYVPEVQPWRRVR